jgi:hypothetical protein
MRSGTLVPNTAEVALMCFRSQDDAIEMQLRSTGYQEIRPKDALQAYLEKLVAKDLAAWATKFPDEFYENIYKLKGWPWPGMSKNRYSVVAHYTNDLVYERLAPGLRAAEVG